MKTRRGLFGLIAGAAAVAVAPFKAKAADSLMTPAQLASMRNYAADIITRPSGWAVTPGEAIQAGLGVRDWLMEKCQGHIQRWGADNPDLDEELRQDMVALIYGRLVPPLSDGKIDLDAVYEQAVRLRDTAMRVNEALIIKLSQPPATLPSA